MKKLLAILSLALLFTAEVKADNIYRCKVAIGWNVPSWAGGVAYPNGICGGWTSMNTNSVYTIYPGTFCNGYIIVGISPPYCGQGMTLGATWAEVSSDGGNTWTPLYYSTFKAIIMPGGKEAEFDTDANGVLDGGHVRIGCN